MINRDSIFKEQHLKNIYNKMLDYLSKSDMAEQRLVDRIERLKLRYPHSKRYELYTKANAWKVIPLLREDGYVDEERFAGRVFESLKDKKDGLRMIKRKMLSRQIKAEVVEKTINEFVRSERHQDLTKITRAAKDKYSRLNDKFGKDPVKKYQIRSKLYAWLAMRGFDAGEAAKIIEKADKNR